MVADGQQFLFTQLVLGHTADPVTPATGLLPAPPPLWSPPASQGTLWPVGGRPQPCWGHPTVELEVRLPTAGPWKVQR